VIQSGSIRDVWNARKRSNFFSFFLPSRTPENSFLQMSPKEKATSIHNLPIEVAIVIAENVFSWAEECKPTRIEGQ